MRYTLSNGVITISVDSYGAELKSIKKDGHEYMWNGNPAWWARTSPTLFPLIGSLKNGRYIAHGKVYQMKHHGFACDMDFEAVEVTKDSLTLARQSSDKTLKIWPYEFVLEVRFSITDATVKVEWKVCNTGNEDLYFSIGAHPGFFCSEGDRYVAYVLSKDSLTPASRERILMVNDEGILSREKRTVDFDNGKLKINRELFRKGNGTLVFADTEIRRIALADSKNREYVTVDFDMPVVSLWAPDTENTPFVCIEPWCGACDIDNTDGIWEHRKYGNKAPVGGSFEKSYTITVK